MTRTCRLSGLVLALAVSVATPAFADTFLVYTQGGIPQPADLFTWCDTPPCDVAEHLSCQVFPLTGEVVTAPEGGNALRINTNVWGGWGVFPQQELDLQAFASDLRFWVKAPDSGIGAYNLKVEFQCNPDPIGFPGGVTYTTSIANHGWDGTANWQEIVIPLVDASFDAPARPLDVACFSTVTAPFMATIELLPFFNTFFIDYVRWETSTSNPGASSVKVQGRQLVVDGKPFVVNAVAYAPVGIGENWQAGWSDRADRYSVDFPLISDMGANAVRLYAPVLTKAMLDAAWAEGLYVIPTFGVDSVQLECAAGKAFMQDRFVEMVRQWKDHPAILFWLVGNEVNKNLGAADLCLDWYPQLDSMAQAAHTAEGASFHPVGTAGGDSTGLADICQAGCSDDTTLPNVDLWGVQLYRGCNFGTAFSEYDLKPDCARPLIVTEFGSDAYNRPGPAPGSEDQTMQANCLDTALEDGHLELAVRTPGGVLSGLTIFEWADEWWKAECEPTTSWTTQDTCASFSNSAYPDPNIHEEWWGIATLSSGDPNARGLRTAYTTVGDAWLGPVCNMQVDAHDPVSGNTTISFDPAAGNAVDQNLHYGPLSAVSSYGYSGSVTGLGATGPSVVTLPPGSLFWVVAAENGISEEGCYGTDSAGTERPCFSGNCDVDQISGWNCWCSSP
jgi:hypothetical protein